MVVSVNSSFGSSSGGFRKTKSAGENLLPFFGWLMFANNDSSWANCKSIKSSPDGSRLKYAIHSENSLELIQRWQSAIDL
jgi:hypothetical protein